MKINIIKTTPKFDKRIEHFPINIRKKIQKTFKLFQKDPLHPSLRLHQLSGKLKGQWSISVDRRYRIIFRRLSEGEVLFLSVGTHDIYE